MGYLVLKKASGGDVLLAGTMPYIQVTKAEQKQELLGVETFTITVESKNPINFEIGDSITAFGRAYWINSPQNIAIADLGDKYVYDIQLEGIQYRLINAVLFDMGVSQYATSTDVIYNANLLEIARLIVTCANFNEGWDMFTLDEENIPQTKRFTFSFSDTNCLAALQTICGKDYFNMLFKLVEQPGGAYMLKIGATVGENQPYSFAVGQTGGAYEIRRAKGSNSGAMFTRLFAFGSSENIATAYRGYSPKLRLPVAVPAGYNLPAGLELVNDTNRNLNYIQVVGATQHISFVKSYPDIKPHRTGIVTGIDAENINKFFDTAMDFDINERLENGETKYLLGGQSAKIHFNTGKLAGLEFDASYNHETFSFTLASYTDDKSQTFPDPKSTAFRVASGDEYVILNINMPPVYVANAEKDLLIAAVKDLQDSFSPANKYSLKVRELYLKKYETPGVETNFFNVGDFVHVFDKTLALDKNIQILSFTRSWLKPLEYTLDLSDVVTISYISQMLGKIEAITNVVQVNKLDNPARTKRNWRVSEQLASMIDTVRADMVLVGNPAGQYDTNIKIEFNYGGNANRVISTAGVLVHSVYSGGLQDGSWNVGSSDVTLTESGIPYYVYIKAGVSDDTASIVYSQDKIDVESVSGFYHFPYCILSSVFEDLRDATLLKGSTQIIGDAIRTGHIRGNGLDIDLNAGIVTGLIKFLASPDSPFTSIDNGLVLTQFIKMVNAAGVETGGISAKTATNNVFLHGGGTIEQAQTKQTNFGVNHSGDVWVRGLIEALSGKIGNFEIISGNIIGKNEIGAERIRLSVENIPNISSIENAYVLAVSDILSQCSFVIEVIYDSEISQYVIYSSGASAVENTITVSIPYSTMLVVEEVNFNASVSQPIAEINGHSQSVTIKNLAGEVVASGVAGELLSIPQAGEYTIKINSTVSLNPFTTEQVADVSFTVENNIKYLENVQKTAIGLNGFYSYFNDNLYVYFNSTDNIFEIKIGTFGFQITPGGVKKLSSGDWVAVNW